MKSYKTPLALALAAALGLAGPLPQALAVLRQADERLARYNQPRLERVRRAVNRDLDRVKSIGVVDLGSLALRYGVPIPPSPSQAE